jgi:glucoamylase
MGDPDCAANYDKIANDIKNTIPAHWNGDFLFQSKNREKDSSVIHALVSFPGMFAPTDPKVLKTIDFFNDQFCHTYTINKLDNDKGIPGVLYGRYEGDIYAGGNPWQLLSSALAELFY